MNFWQNTELKYTTIGSGKLERAVTERKGVYVRDVQFFCGIHFVVSMAETVSETIHLFEKAHHEDVSENTEAGTIRLIRTACKAFER